MARAYRVSHEPPSERMPGDGNVSAHQLVQGGRCDVDISHKDKLRRLREAGVCRFFVSYGNGQPLAFLGNLGLVRLNIDRERTGMPDA